MDINYIANYVHHDVKFNPEHTRVYSLNGANAN